MRITPVIRRTRVRAERYEVCPHCMLEIHEKGHFVDQDDYVYHRGCVEKGPIDRLDVERGRRELARFLGKAAGGRQGFVERNVAGVDYTFNWTAKVGQPGDPVTDVEVRQPAGMPDDLWMQTREAVTEQAMSDAYAMMRETDMARTAVGDEDGATGDWLSAALASGVASGMARTAQSDFFRISIPFGSKTDVKIFTDVVNQGIDSRLEAFTRSRFSRSDGELGGSRLVLEFHRSELPLLVRRLREYGEANYDEKDDGGEGLGASAERWAEDIAEHDEYYESPPGTEYVPKEFMSGRQDLEWVAVRADGGEMVAIAKAEDEKPTEAARWDASDWRNGWHNVLKRMLDLSMPQDKAFDAWANKTFGASKAPPDPASISRIPSPDPSDADVAGLFEGGDEITREAAKKPIPIGQPRPAGKPIDDALLADGLGAFMDVLINYHSGPEGGKIAKWIVAVCQDPRFAAVAPMLEQFHRLPAEIYGKVVEIAKGDAKVAAVIAGILKTSISVRPWPMAVIEELNDIASVEAMSLSSSDGYPPRRTIENPKVCTMILAREPRMDEESIRRLNNCLSLVGRVSIKRINSKRVRVTVDSR